MQIVQSDALISDGKILGRSPRDGEALEPVTATRYDDVSTAVRQARDAQAKWAALPVRERCTRVKKLRASLMSRADEFMELYRAELGRADTASYLEEFFIMGEIFTYWAKAAPDLLSPDARSLNPLNFPGKAGILELHPKGVIAVIAPWNYPAAIPLRAIVPALCAGNAVVFKPSEFTPRVGAALVRLFDELGVPGVVTLVQGGPTVGEALIEANPDHVCFTGSDAAGRKIARACADRLITYSLELGGKDAAIVLSDADLDRTADGIVWGAFNNGGQNCASIERVFVVESVAAAFTDKVLERTKSIRVGGGGRDTYEVAPQVRPQGLATVEQHVKDALDSGATLRAGGKATGDGRFFEPTVLTDVNEEMAVMTAETFGPVMPIVVVKDDAEAVQCANRSVYGLTASVWTKDVARGRKLASELRCGVVTINNHGFTAALPHAPWTGMGQSGSGGVTNSRFAFYDMVHPRYVCIDRLGQKDTHWYPHNASALVLARNLAKLHGKSGGKLAAIVGVIKGFLTRWKT